LLSYSGRDHFRRGQIATEDLMGTRDRFGLPLTTASAEAAAWYIAAVDLLLSANLGAEEQLEGAVAADPDFALAHIARARLLQLRARILEAKAAAARAKSLCDGVTARERHVDAIALAVDGAAVEALAMVRAHASEYPRDALALSLAVGCLAFWASAAGATITRRNWRCSKNWRPIGMTIGGFSAISAGPTSRRGRLPPGSGWSSDRSPATRAMPMQLTNALTAFSRPATPPAVPPLSRIG
jgi:hypothetical protein